ncbi:MAG: TetR/AcrR family transcriptional regulator [Deltaproteobacteria bacterium]|nr:TetR/AcrR family transcriptional regulator [Deltaproteobacteria bacterium]
MTERSASPTPRQEEILDRAMDLVRESGLAALTTRKIAEKMGFSEAALYRHFPTKKDLVNGLMERLDQMLLGPVQEIAADDSLSHLERLKRILLHHVHLVREQNSLPILLLAEASATDDPGLLGRMRSILHTYLSVLEGLVREAQTKGLLPGDLRNDCLALLLLGAPAALAIRHRLLPDARLEDRFENTLIPFLTEHIISTRGDHP